MPKSCWVCSYGGSMKVSRAARAAAARPASARSRRHARPAHCAGRRCARGPERRAGLQRLRFGSQELDEHRTILRPQRARADQRRTRIQVPLPVGARNCASSAAYWRNSGALCSTLAKRPMPRQPQATGSTVVAAAAGGCQVEKPLSFFCSALSSASSVTCLCTSAKLPA